MTQTSLTENKFSFLSLTCCLSLTNLFACTSPTFSDSFVNCRQTLVPWNAALSTHRHKLRAAVFSVKKKKIRTSAHLFVLGNQHHFWIFPEKSPCKAISHPGFSTPLLHRSQSPLILGTKSPCGRQCCCGAHVVLQSQGWPCYGAFHLDMLPCIKQIMYRPQNTHPVIVQAVSRRGPAAICRQFCSKQGICGLNPRSISAVHLHNWKLIPKAVLLIA